MEKIQENQITADRVLPRKKNDIITKTIFMEWFVDLLRFLYPDADQVFDLARGATAMDKELLEIIPDWEREGGTLLADMLMKVYLRDGTEKWLLIHLEIEGQSRDNFAERMWRYYIRLTDRYPVPIIPIAVFTGGPHQKWHDRYQFSMLGTVLSFQFKSYHVFEHSEQELLAHPNVMALVILACQAEAQEAKLGDLRLNEIKKRIVAGLITRGVTDTRQIIQFIRFLNNMIYLTDMELNDNFVQTVGQLTKGMNTMTFDEVMDMVERERREERLKQARIEYNILVVSNLLEKFDFTDEQAAEVAEVSLDFVRDVRANLIEKK